MSEIKDHTIIDPDSDRSGVNAPKPLQTVGTVNPSGMAAPDKRPQGSGRFTNLQKYIQANQGAGQRIAGQVGKGVKQEIGKEEREAGEYYKNLGSAISGARKVTEEGAKYQQTLKDIGENVKGAQAGDTKDLGIQQFTQDPGFKQFQNIQAGRGIDEKLLALRQQQAAKESGEYLQSAQAAQQALGSEGGRFNLLRKTFGGAARPGYSTGQQRLDQALLAQQGLGGLRSDISQDLRSATESQRQAQQAAGTVSGLASEEQGIIGNLNTQAGLNEQEYMNMLGSYVDPIQQQRQVEWDQLQTALGAYKPQEIGDYNPEEMPQQGLSGQQLARLGISGPTRAYNVLENLTQPVAYQGTKATEAKDIATQGDVDRYADLAKMMGKDPRQNITQAGSLGESYSAVQGETGLAQQLAKADKDFREKQLKATARLQNNEYGPGGDLVTEARIQDILAGGRGGIKTTATGELSTDKMKDFYEGDVWKQFQDLLRSENYGRTIGGDIKGQAPGLYGSDEYVDPSTGLPGYKGK